MLLGVIADDFTGASDIANTLTTSGMATRLLIGVPAEPPGDAPYDASVVALKSRSIAAGDAITQSLRALDYLRASGARQFVFKYCSTFDSTADGNIGPVAEALARRLGARGVLCCPAFPGAGRTVYQGHLFVGDRLLSESGLERHPLNPMTDPDLRRWLARQCSGAVGLIPHAIVRQGAAAVAAAAAAASTTLLIADAISDNDLRVLGAAAAAHTLLTGGSGIALGLADNFRASGLLHSGASVFRGAKGAAAILAGSCSAATRGQIAAHRAGHPALAIDINGVMTGAVTADQVAAFAIEHRDALPLIYSTADPDVVAAQQRLHGRDALAERLERLFGEVAVQLAAAGFERLIIAGGETSGAVVSALGITAFDLGPEIDPGIPALGALRLPTGPPLALALKSGNFGGPDFFARAALALQH